MKKICLAFFVLLISLTSFAQVGPITGVMSVCTGSTTTLSCPPAGGTWYSLSPGIATVGSSSGDVTGISAGTATISYDLGGGGSATATVTVNPSPLAITCPAPGCSVCMGDSVTLFDTTTGGVWSNSLPGITSIGSATGVITGVSLGTDIISYTLPNGCYSVTPFNVNALPTAYTVTGGGSYCAGGTGVVVGLSGSQLGAVYQLYLGPIPVGVAIAGTGSAISFGLQTGAGTYTVTGTFTSTVCSAPMTGSVAIVVNPMPVAISCPSGGCSVCAGSSITLTDATSGGTWSSSSPGTASVGPSTGLVTGLSSGLTTITYTLPGGCYVIDVVTVNPSPGSIGGSGTTCIGSSTTLFDSYPGGTWTSGATAIATVGSSTGAVTGVATGTATITYTLPAGCLTTTVVSVSPTPTSITGITTICLGSTSTLSDGIPGGIWQSNNVAIASVGSFTGLVTGVSIGTTTITYLLSSGCYRTTPVTIISSPAPITGPVGGNDVCVFGTITLADATPGGIWTSSNPSLATTDTAGVVTGVAVGVVIITYNFGSGCLTTTTATVSPLPAPITGINNVCTGFNITLYDTSSGGSWSSAGVYTSVGASTGVVTGVIAGMETITYTLPTGCFTTFNVTVDSLPCSPTLGINEAKINAIELFPNPTNDVLTIKTQEGAYHSFTITNSIGQTLIQQILPGKEITVNVKFLPSAIYYVTLRGENGVVVKRFVKG